MNVRTPCPFSGGGSAFGTVSGFVCLPCGFLNGCWKPVETRHRARAPGDPQGPRKHVTKVYKDLYRIYVKDCLQAQIISHPPSLEGFWALCFRCNHCFSGFNHRFGGFHSSHDLGCYELCPLQVLGHPVALLQLSFHVFYVGLVWFRSFRSFWVWMWIILRAKDFIDEGEAESIVPL